MSTYYGHIGWWSIRSKPPSFTIYCQILLDLSPKHVATRSAQRVQTSAERQHKQYSNESGFRTSNSWIRTVILIVTKIELIGPWAMPYPSKKFRQNPFTTFSVIRRTDRQTDRQTDRSENITSFGGGNKFSVQWSLELPPHMKRIATKYQYSKAANNISQDSIT